jgi:hypothetical protein
MKFGPEPHWTNRRFICGDAPVSQMLTRPDRRGKLRFMRARRYCAIDLSGCCICQRIGIDS